MLYLYQEFEGFSFPGCTLDSEEIDQNGENLQPRVSSFFYPRAAVPIFRHGLIGYGVIRLGPPC